jgi:dihydrofolate reductase
MKFFKEYTYGKTVVMGNKTFQSIGNPLKDRINIVLTRTKIGTIKNHIDIGSAEFCTINQLFNRFYHYSTEFVVIGGSQIYNKFLEMDVVRNVIITHIPGKHNCDTFFPSVHLKNYGKFDERKLTDELRTSFYVRKIC